MKIWLNQLDGTSLPLEVASYQQLLQQLQEGARLVSQGSNLDEAGFAALAEGANVYVTGDLEGGKKKKKKKVYTTKKKSKHIHKRVKLSIYTLYGIDGTSALTQARAT